MVPPSSPSSPTVETNGLSPSKCQFESDGGYMSDWKESGVNRRDFRASKDGPEVPRGHRGIKAPTRRKKKDAARWCNGKVGVEHSLTLIDRRYYSEAFCTACGRKEHNLSVEALAQVYKRAADYVEYSELCKEFGHVWEAHQCKTWYGTLRNIKVCSICSYCPNSWTWEDLDNENVLW